jgi:hypothetical protein
VTGRFGRRRAGAALVLLCLLALAVYAAHRAGERAQQRATPAQRTQAPDARYLYPANPAWLRSALRRVAVSGGVIHLPAGRIPFLTLLALAPRTPIRLVGRSSTALAGIAIKRSSRITLSGLRITPDGGPALVELHTSRHIVFRDVRFLGLDEDRGVALRLQPDDRDITVSHSEFSRCQHGLACILARGRGLTVDHVRFHTVRDAAVIRGAADDVTISDSDLHDALPGTHADNHNDLIQILGGGPWTIQRNHFGVRSHGAAQIFVDPRLAPPGRAHDVHIYSNVFTGSNREMWFAIHVRTPAEPGMSLPSGVEIVNNTIISAIAAAIRLAPEYAKLPARRRPLVQNNVLGLQKHDLCGLARMRTNVVERGIACPGDRRGDAHLDGAGKPTAASAALLARGTEAASPRTDASGAKRSSPPAVGAYDLAR